MSSRRTREQLKVQILEAERMAESTADHPIMGFSFQKKLEELRQELNDTPITLKEPTVALLFSGGPVWGSNGIEATFISKAILPFQKMVHADLVQRGYGKVPSRGQLRNADDAKLFVTALRRGSFGVELSKIEDGDLFNEDLVSDSLANVSKLVESSAKSDEDFAASLENISERTIAELKSFLKVMADDDAGITIESGGIRAALEPVDVKSAYSRVAETDTTQTEERVSGQLKGILLESRRFDFIDQSQNTITGTLGAELSEENAVALMTSFFNRKCVAVLQKTTISLKSGRVRDSFILKDIVPE